MKESLKIPYEHRFKFAEPLGELIAGNRELTLTQINDKFKSIAKTGIQIRFYLVGDIVTQDFLADPFLHSFIRVCIIDEKTQRKKIEIDTHNIFENLIELINPAGTISANSWSAIKKAISSEKRTLITITEGEEDLLVIPLVLELKLTPGIKDFIFYGQPPITDAEKRIPQGIVMTEVDEEIKKRVTKLLELMEII